MPERKDDNLFTLDHDRKVRGFYNALHLKAWILALNSRFLLPFLWVSLIILEIFVIDSQSAPAQVLLGSDQELPTAFQVHNRRKRLSSHRILNYLVNVTAPDHVLFLILSQHYTPNCRVWVLHGVFRELYPDQIRYVSCQITVEHKGRLS